MCGLSSIFVGYLVCRSLEDILIGEVDGSDGYDSEKDSCRPSKLSEDLQLKKFRIGLIVIVKVTKLSYEIESS